MQLLTFLVVKLQLR